MIRNVSMPPMAWPMPPILLNSIEPRNPPAIPVKNGWRWKKLPPPAAAAAPIGLVLGTAAWGAGFALRVIGWAPFCSKLREPRLPMLEPGLEEELPARASARLGANVSTAHRNNGAKSRHCGN